MTKDERQRQIEIIMREFDFPSVRKAMVALEWCYGTERGKGPVPTMGKIKDMARYCLTYLEPTSRYFGTGGFEAYWNGRGKLGLRFIVSEFYTDE